MLYRPEPRPTQLLADLIRSHWNYKDEEGNLDMPEIVELPLKDSPRIDLTDVDYVLISMQNYNDELIHIGFKNRDITADMRIEIRVSSSRQTFYNYVQEIRKIIHINQHDPCVYLLDGFERYNSRLELLKAWGDPSIELGEVFDLHNSDPILEDSPSYLVVDYPINNRGAFVHFLPYAREDEQYENLDPVRFQYVSFYARLTGVGAFSPTDLNVGFYDTGEEEVVITTTSSLTREWKRYRNYLNITSDFVADKFYFHIDSGTENFAIDYIQLGTQEYQFLRYKGFKEQPGTFGYWQGAMDCTYRDVGAPIERLM